SAVPTASWRRLCPPRFRDPLETRVSQRDQSPPILLSTTTSSRMLHLALRILDTPRTTGPRSLLPGAMRNQVACPLNSPSESSSIFLTNCALASKPWDADLSQGKTSRQLTLKTLTNSSTATYS